MDCKYAESDNFPFEGSLENHSTEFADCTVITVAHRIPTVMDCTMVLAISDGESHTLLQPFSIEYSIFFCTRIVYFSVDAIHYVNV